MFEFFEILTVRLTVNVLKIWTYKILTLKINQQKAETHSLPAAFLLHYSAAKLDNIFEDVNGPLALPGFLQSVHMQYF